MNYQTSSGEFALQGSWIIIPKGFKGGPIGTPDAVVNRDDMIAYLNIERECSAAQCQDCNRSN